MVKQRLATIVMPGSLRLVTVWVVLTVHQVNIPLLGPAAVQLVMLGHIRTLGLVAALTVMLVNILHPESLLVPIV